MAAISWAARPMSPSVKGCQMPALSRRRLRTHRCSVGRRRTSPEGGNRGMLRGSRGRPHGYGDLNRPWVGCGSDKVSDRGAAVVRRVDCRWTNRDFLPASYPPIRATVAWHKGCPYRRWPITIGTVNAVGILTHAAPRSWGGARIGCPRTKVSMMIIGAPQCGQT